MSGHIWDTCHSPGPMQMVSSLVAAIYGSSHICPVWCQFLLAYLVDGLNVLGLLRQRFQPGTGNRPCEHPFFAPFLDANFVFVQPWQAQPITAFTFAFRFCSFTLASRPEPSCCFTGDVDTLLALSKLTSISATYARPLEHSHLYCEILMYISKEGLEVEEMRREEI